MYRDRRTNDEVDASKVIWILATNLGDTVIDRSVLGLQGTSRQPIDLEEPQLIYIGHPPISIDDDGRDCQPLAKSYIKKLRARSLMNAVTNLSLDFASVYSKEDEEVKETFNAKPLAKYTVHLHPVSESVDRILVVRVGHTAVTQHN